MPIELDHIMVPSRDKDAAARQLAALLGVRWGPAKVGPFAAVYVSAGLTIDFDQWETEFPGGHYCFRVDDATFDDVLRRLQGSGVPYRSEPLGAADYAVNTALGGRIVYWSEPDGHVWELLTKSYAREANGPSATRRPGGG
jgi:catechol 2,3-dioxygenase-like lactoylglutathione lyase family enzyme